MTTYASNSKQRGILPHLPLAFEVNYKSTVVSKTNICAKKEFSTSGDGCTQYVCQSGGTCYDDEDPYGLGYYCACRENFGGFHCQIGIFHYILFGNQICRLYESQIALYLHVTWLMWVVKWLFY